MCAYGKDCSSLDGISLFQTCVVGSTASHYRDMRVIEMDTLMRAEFEIELDIWSKRYEDSCL